MVVYHDSPIAAWSNTSALRNAGISSLDFAVRCTVEGTESSLEDGEAEAASQRHTESAASSMLDADAATDEEMLTTEQRPVLESVSMDDEDTAMDDEEVELPEPWNLLSSLRVSDDAERQPLAEDLYFAGRLAATCVILLRDGMLDAAKVLGQWSVDLVGKRNWNKMVESYSTAPRDKNDNGAWMAYLLAEVDINLRKFDEEKAKELRDFVGELQEFGIVPQPVPQETQDETLGGQ